MHHPRPMSDLQRNPADQDQTIRELRVRVGLLQSELEHVRREHAALRASIAHDVAALSRRYLEPAKPAAAGGVRTIDGVIFGGWDHVDAASTDPDATGDDDRNSRSA